jgi:hypothetical protein
MKVFIGPPTDCGEDSAQEIEIHSYDTWSMDRTLAPIVLPMLKQLQKTKHGSPAGMRGFNQTSNQAQGSFDFYKDDDELADTSGHQEWDEIMNKMIWSFTQLVDDVQPMELYCTYRDPRPFEEMFGDPDENGLTEFVSESTYDWVKARTHEDRVDEGFALFGEYFRNLWD